MMAKAALAKVLPVWCWLLAVSEAAPAPAPALAPTKPAQARCSDEAVPPVAEYVMYNQSTHIVSPACSAASFGDKVPDSCCTEPGGMLPAMVGKTFAEIYMDGGNTTCPLLLPAYGMHAHLQCNADNTVTYGEQCTPDCSPCNTVMTMGMGCYRVGDLPGTNWFVKSSGCACMAQTQARCSDTTAPPVAEYVMYNQSTHTVSPTCSMAAWGDKVPDSCCTEAGAMLPAMIGKTFTQIYEDSGYSTCPLLLPDYGMHAHLQCNADSTISYGEDCVGECSPCDKIMTMSAGCYRVGDLPGTSWFVKSQGCGCLADDPRCVCTGNQGKAAKQSYYPVDMGEKCDAWDSSMDYCQPGGSSEDATWCPSKWCYTDAACPDAANGTYFANIAGPQLYYSYGACGEEDTYTTARCSDETVPPNAEYIMYNLSTHNVSAECMDAAFGDKVADSCCTEAGAMLPALVGKTFAQLYQDSGNSNCPLIIPAFNMHGIMQCNSDGTVKYSEQCDMKCSTCKSTMTMEMGCYKANDIPGTAWFVQSQGCTCTGPAPTPAPPATPAPPPTIPPTPAPTPIQAKTTVEFALKLSVGSKTADQLQSDTKFVGAMKSFAADKLDVSESKIEVEFEDVSEPRRLSESASRRLSGGVKAKFIVDVTEEADSSAKAADLAQIINDPEGDFKDTTKVTSDIKEALEASGSDLANEVTVTEVEEATTVEITAQPTPTPTNPTAEPTMADGSAPAPASASAPAPAPAGEVGGSPASAPSPADAPGTAQAPAPADAPESATENATVPTPPPSAAAVRSTDSDQAGERCPSVALLVSCLAAVAACLIMG